MFFESGRIKLFECISSAVASLSVNKACGMDSLSAEHLLYASPGIHTLLAIML